MVKLKIHKQDEDNDEQELTLAFHQDSSGTINITTIDKNSPYIEHSDDLFNNVRILGLSYENAWGTSALAQFQGKESSHVGPEAGVDSII